LMSVMVLGNFIFFALFVQVLIGYERRPTLPYLGWGLFIVLLAFAPTNLFIKSVTTSETTGLHVPTLGSYTPLLVLTAYGFLGYAIYNLSKAYRITQSIIQRNRIRYLLISAGVGVMGSFSNLIPLLQAYPVDVFANVVSALIIAYAILRHQLLDIRIVVRKGLLYSIPTLVIGVGYFLVITLVINIFHTDSGQSLFVLSVFVAMIAALVAQPVRDYIQFWIDRLFFREKYDTNLMIERLSNHAAMVLDLDILVNTILSEVSQAIHISHCIFFLKDERGISYRLTSQVGEPSISSLKLMKSHPVVEWLSSNKSPLVRHELELMPVFKALWGEEREELETIGAEIFIPVKAKGELVAIFALGPKLSQQPYTSEDQSTLTTLANQTAISIEKARLYRDLEKTLVQLRSAHNELEKRVQERTAALAQANLELQGEITERKKAELQLEQSLQEKEALLKEIHHRVKNNMQVVSSLLSIQSSRMDDPISLEMLRDSQNRVRSMALIHEKLYQSENITKVNLKDYTSSLAHYLFTLYRKADVPIELEIDSDGVSLGIDEAVPCGLILNELISNSLKHAFTIDCHQSEPKVKIGLAQDSHGEITIEVSDNGRGLPDDFIPEQTQTLGLQLVRMLVSQLNGNVTFSKTNGTSAIFSFHNN